MDINLTTGSTDLLDVENIEYSFPLLIASIIFNWSFSLASFATITLPTWIYKLLSWSFTLQLNFTTLLTGDTLMLEKERSFYIVVDGHVQVFVKTVNEEEIALDPFESDDYN
ncbi:10545_t:CDS:1, partial [Entrophospora sp. SA101]